MPNNNALNSDPSKFLVVYDVEFCREYVALISILMDRCHFILCVTTYGTGYTSGSRINCYAFATGWEHEFDCI